MINILQYLKFQKSVFWRKISKYSIFILQITLVFFSPLIGATQKQEAPEDIINKAIEKVGINKVKGKVLHYFSMESRLQSHQSERVYPPFYSFFNEMEIWLDPENNVSRTSSRALFFGIGPGISLTGIADNKNAFMIRDTFVISVPHLLDEMNVWRVLFDWKETKSVRLGKDELFRNYIRTVIIRDGKSGEERLFIDKKTGFPVKYDYFEKHYLWGQVHKEIVYNGWLRIGDICIPSGIYKIIDGNTEVYKTVGKTEIIDKNKAPDLNTPQKVSNPSTNAGITVTQASLPVDTVKISNNTYLLKNRFYTETVSLIDNVVYIFDATTSEDRARMDEAWIRKLFPGNYPVTVIVTDLAWPHIAGLRYWVSKGAKIVSHKMSEDFLRKVIERKWTLEPDELEKNRKNAKFKFIGIDKLTELANGKIRLLPIDGISSEGALIALLTDENFLWASDFVQRIDLPTQYATEVIQAVNREGFKPKKLAAEHLSLTEWEKLESVNGFKK